MSKCLCKLEIVPVILNPECPWHGDTAKNFKIVTLPGATAEQLRQSIDQMNALYPQIPLIRDEVVVRLGRWRCPVCNHWVDEKAGWRITPEEEICGECYRILKGGETKKQGDDQWTPR
jgi:hypothetical protein